MKYKRFLIALLCCLALMAQLTPPVAAASVSVSWTASDRHNISSTRPEATLATVLNVSGTSISNVSKVGVRLYSGVLDVQLASMDDPLSLSSGSYVEMWYDVSGYLSAELPYRYQFFGVINGVTYTSDMYSFTAGGTGERYTVTFDAGGGTVSPGSKTVVYGGKYGTLPTPTRPGYSFDDWSPDKSGMVRQICRSSSQVTTRGNHTLYAMWDANQYTVSLQANGGSVSTGRITVTYGDNYGDLPIPSRSGYSFDGWYTKETGGNLVTGSTSVTTAANHSLYAHWTQTEESAQSCTVYFNANGGDVDASGKTVTVGDRYGTLPTPTRGGYTFDGWYTSSSGGTKIISSSTVSQAGDHTLYAHWTQEKAKTYTVTFNANGGVVGTASKIVTAGDRYGTLPTPTRSGYTFDGWYTSSGGGTKITSSSTVSLTEDQTLYAHWNAIKAAPSLAALTYSFGNSEISFGYSSSYRIPLARYQLIFGNNLLAQSLYNQNETWEGNCYGMSTTASLFFQEGNGISVSGFNKNASLPSALSIKNRNSSWGLTLTEFIEAMQVSQFGYDIFDDYENNKNQLNKLCQAVSSFQRTGTNPVVIALFKNKSGHAVVGYSIVDVSATESRLMVYDCNYPNTERYITLTKNSSGQYTGWYYHLNNAYDWGSRYSGSRISFVPYSHFLASWNNRGGANKVNLLTINTDNAAIKDVNGNTIASIRNGEVITDREDIYPLINIGLKENGTAGSNAGTSLWIPADSLYTVTNTDRSVSNFEVTMVHVDQSATVNTTASEIVLAVNDGEELNYAGLSQTSGDSYTITLNSTLKGSHSDVQLTGTSVKGSSPALSQISGKLYANGADLGTNASLRVDGAAASENILSGAIPGISGMFGGNNDTVLPFTDVKHGVWYEDAVRNLYQRGLMNGVSSTLFDPNGSLTRAHLVTILHRLDGSPSVSGSTFSDVPNGTWYHDGVQWAASNGIVNGYGNGCFGPEDMLTHEQMFTILFRYAQYKGYDVSKRSAISSYKDASEISNYAMEALQWSLAEALIYNSDSSYLQPRDIANRAEIAWSVWKFIFNLEK